MQTEKLPVSAEKARAENPVTLAFLGDAVYSLSVREKLVKNGGGKPHDYQVAAAKIVSAKGQSEFLEKVERFLTEEESEIYRRGRNAKKNTRAKNASVVDYNRSTGFEAVLGFLYLTGRFDRIDELLALDDEKRYEIQERNRIFKP